MRAALVRLAVQLGRLDVHVVGRVVDRLNHQSLAVGQLHSGSFEQWTAHYVVRLPRRHGIETKRADSEIRRLQVRIPEPRVSVSVRTATSGLSPMPGYEGSRRTPNSFRGRLPRRSSVY
jgi:hypothetical protein